MAIKFTGKAQQALNRALYLAREMGHTYIGTEHLLLALAAQSECIASGILEKAGLTFENLRTLVRKTAGVGEPTDIAPSDMTPALKKIIEEAAGEAGHRGGGYIGTEHLLYAILCESECFGNKVIIAKGGSISVLKNELSVFIDPDFKKNAAKKGAAEVTGAPNVSKFGKNLIKAAKEGELDPVIGREAETERVMQILARRAKNNPCLVGEAGVGKTAVVEGLALLIAEGKAPEGLKDKIIVSLDMPSMVAGAKYRGEFEERLKGVMEEVAKNRNIILFIDELHTIMGAGAAEGAVDAANIIKPALARGALRMIGATTRDEYRRHIEKDSALERRFQPVAVAEPTEAQAVAILKGLRDRYEAHHKLKISDEAITAAVTLSSRYIRDRFLPDKAIDLIDEAASGKRISLSVETSGLLDIERQIRDAGAEKKEAILSEDFEGAARIREHEKHLITEYRAKKEKEELAELSEKTVVTAEDVEKIVSKSVGIPASRLSEGEGKKLAFLEENLMKRIIGQDEAVKVAAKAVKRGRVGMKAPERPCASLLFLGPTGVGKTELTKALAKEVFGSEKRVIRLDMSEFSERHSVSKIIGSPPGYVGFDNGTTLLEAVRREPCSIVLFDEAEKAHPDVLNILLRILDEGKITDSTGRETDFQSTIIILTSNVGGERVSRQTELGFSANADKESLFLDAKRDVEGELKRWFSPEFLGRIDEKVIFRALCEEDMEKIAELFLKEISLRLSKSGMEIEFSADVKQVLAKDSFDKKYGARELRRAVRKKIEDTLADEILSGRIKEGDHVSCSVDREGAAKYRVMNKASNSLAVT